MHRLDVLRQPSQAQPQNPRGQVGYSLRRQDDEARVVGDQMKALELLLRRPADPAVARGQLERARLPAEQCEPTLAMHRDMAQPLADDTVEPQVVVLGHQPVPAPVLLRPPGRAHRDPAQINGRIRGRQRRHDRHTATSRTKWPAPRSPHAGRRADKKRALIRAGPFFSPGRGGEMGETTDAGVDSGRAPNSPRRPHGGGSDPANGVFGLSGQSCPTPPGGAPGRA